MTSIFIFRNQITDQQMNKETANDNKSKESIIVRKEIIERQLPGQAYFAPYIKNYEDVVVKKGEIFAIEGIECESCDMVLELKLKLVDIKDKSIIVETQFSGLANITKEIVSGETINPTPNLMDVINSFEFQIGNKNNQLLLTYKTNGISTMPMPTN